eukprot:GFUD01018803.1.p1 GENE.GFUD01018803.1~~GFUD01018803.1.p1  ORF type:complete len:250 (+),score=24.24 GFUD01018803.1:303-1052(+)
MSRIKLIELVYFDIHARGELTRLCFAAAGREEEYKDTRLPLFMESREAAEEWSEVHSPKTPFGPVPYLNVEEEIGDHNPEVRTFQVGGDGAVESFVARHLNLLGQTEGDAAICQTISVNAVGLLGPQLTRAGLTGNEGSIAQWVQPNGGYIGETFAHLERYVENIKEGRPASSLAESSYVINGALSLADLAIYNAMDECVKGPRSQRHFPKVEEAVRRLYPRLWKIHDQVSSDLAPYLQARQSKFAKKE